MIEFKLFFALISYYFVMFATPGPNNAMLTASGIKFGFRKTLPHLVGIPFGHVIQITLVCFGLGSLFQRSPFIQFYLKWLCFVYLFYLSWKIIGSFSNNDKETGFISHLTELRSRLINSIIFLFAFSLKKPA